MSTGNQPRTHSSTRLFSRSSSSVNTLVVLGLLGLFAVLCLFVVVLGAGFYQKLTNHLNDNDQIRASLNYVANKVRMLDEDAVLSLEEWDGLSVLVLEDSEYTDCIYFYGGRLMEQAVSVPADFDPVYGEALIPVYDFSMELTDNGCLSLSVRTSSGIQRRLRLQLPVAPDAEGGPVS